MRRHIVTGIGIALVGLIAAVYFAEEPTSFPAKKLVRVDVLPNKDAKGAEDHMIASDTDLAEYREVLDAIDWQPNNISTIANADVEAILLYELDKNMPERLVEHDIRFAADGTAEINSNLETERYAVLDEAAAGALQKLVDQQN